MSALRVIRRVVKSAATAVNRIFQRSQSTVCRLVRIEHSRHYPSRKVSDHGKIYFSKTSSSLILELSATKGPHSS